MNSFSLIDYEINQNLYRKLLMSNKFIIIQINSLFENNDPGTYKIFNNFNNYQKIIFFAILLKKIYTDK